MKCISSLVVLLLLKLFAFSQQLNNTSFWELYPVLHNPATAGSGGEAVVGGSFRKQWSSMPGSPQTGLLYGRAYLSNAKIGLGGYLYHDVTGPTSRTGLQMAYAYHIPLKENSSFSIGLEARLQQFAFDRAKLQQNLGGMDPVAAGRANRFKGDAGLGMAYTSPSFQIGASVSQLLQSKLNWAELGTTSQQGKLARHYYLHSHYIWNTDEAHRIIPNLLVIYLPNAPLELQGGVRMEHNRLFWYGLAWRMRQAWMASAGVNIKEKFSVGYSFDIYSTPLSVFDKGSNGHELLLRYRFTN